MYVGDVVVWLMALAAVWTETSCPVQRVGLATIATVAHSTMTHWFGDGATTVDPAAAAAADAESLIENQAPMNF